MDSKSEVVSTLPLATLRRDGIAMPSARARELAPDDVANLLRVGLIQFVVADVGSAVRWIPLNECYDFWKQEVKPHLAAPDAAAELNEYPGGYCYFASEWTSLDEAAPIVVCEKYH